MIQFQLAMKLALDYKPLYAAVDKARQQGLYESAKMVSREAKTNIRKTKRKRSKPGEFPRGKTGNLRSSIRIHMSKTVAYVGATWPKGAHANLIEHGTSDRPGTGRIEPRPFMQLARARVAARVPSNFRAFF